MPPPVFPLTFAGSVGWPIKQTPMFNTITQSAFSGRGELRIPTMNFPRWDFVIDLTYIPGDAQKVNSVWQQLINFYMLVQGAAGDWLFLHPYDNTVGSYTITGTITSGIFIVNENVIQGITLATARVITVVPGTLTISPYSGVPDNSHTWVGQSSGAIYTPSALPVLASSQAIATGDGVTLAFSMLRTFISPGAYDMIQNFVYAPKIYVNNVLQSALNYSIDIYGTLTFTPGNAPPLGQTLSWSGQFYYRCRFMEDEWVDLQENWAATWTANGLKFRSVLL